MSPIESMRAFWIFGLVLVLLAGGSATRAIEGVNEDHWYEIRLAGAHVGWQNSRSMVEDDQQASATDMAMSTTTTSTYRGVGSNSNMCK